MQTVTSQHAIIRRMQSGDIDVVTKIENAVAMVPWDQQLFAGCLRVYDSFVAVISNNVVSDNLIGDNRISDNVIGDNQDDTIIGFGVIAIYHSIKEAHLLNLGVDKDRQRMGVGELLLGYLINLCVHGYNDPDNLERTNSNRIHSQENLERINLDQMHNQKNLDQANKFKIFLEVNSNNQAAINLYKKFNFVEVGFRKNYYLTANGREDALVFCLDC